MSAAGSRCRGLIRGATSSTVCCWRTRVSRARERLTLIRIFEELRALGYEGSYDAVRRYAKRWRAERGATTAEAYVPHSTLTIWGHHRPNPAAFAACAPGRPAKSQSLNGAPLRKAPGFLASTGT
jgi:hypothetical protein